MRFITVRDFRTSSAKIWKELPKEQEMVITNNGKPIALLTPLSEKNLDETLDAICRAKAFEALRQIHKQSIENGTDKMTLDEINQIIALARKERQEKDRKCELS